MQIFEEGVRLDKHDKVVYVHRKSDNRKVGVLLATLGEDYPNIIRIGFSKCHTNKDVFNPHLGKHIAAIRANKYVIKNTYYVPVPESLVVPIIRFALRCTDYYKGKELPLWIKNMFVDYQLTVMAIKKEIEIAKTKSKTLPTKTELVKKYIEVHGGKVISQSKHQKIHSNLCNGQVKEAVVSKNDDCDIIIT